MRHQSRLAVLAAAVVGVSAGVSYAEQFLSPSDFIIAIDGSLVQVQVPVHPSSDGVAGII